jgi:hypothetical protein
VSDQRQKLNQIVDKLAKLLKHLTNESANERHNACDKIHELLKSVGLHGDDLSSLLKAAHEQDSPMDIMARLLMKDDELLLKIALEVGTFYNSPQGVAYADLVVNGHRQTMALSDPEFTQWLTHQFFREKQKAPKTGALKDAIRTLEACAKYEGQPHEVSLRVARDVHGTVYVDLGDPDWKVVEITPQGWEVTTSPNAVRFRRPSAMGALPIPERGGSLWLLRQDINFSDDAFVMFVTGLVDALIPGFPHPIFYYAGDAGAGKTSLLRIQGGLIDPSVVKNNYERKLPKKSTISTLMFRVVIFYLTTT